MAKIDSTEIHPQISFDYCIKCTICNTVCPVTPIYPDFPGPKYCGPDSERFRIQKRYAVEDAAQYCINCKRCESICPSDVKITHFIEQDKFQHKKTIVKKMRGLFFIYLDLVGYWATYFSGLVNIVLRWSWLRKIMQFGLGIAAKRELPQYSKNSFARYFSKKYQPPQNPLLTIYFYHGCYVNYNDLQLGVDFIEFCDKHNIALRLFKQKCCGIPIASAGDSKAYQKRVQYNFRHIWPIIDNAKTNPNLIVSLSSTCSMALKKDYLRHIPLDNAQKEYYQSQILYLNEFIQYMEHQNIPVQWPAKYDRIVYHVPCHVKYSGEMANTISLLQQMTDNLIVFDENCCGIGGSYGVKKEFYDIAQSVGQLLFDKLAQYQEDIWVSECETCRMQITENTGHKMYHPLTLLVRSIKK